MSQETLSKINSRHVEEISSSRNEPDWLKQYRQSSLTIYDALPIETSPLYNKYTDAKKWILNKFPFQHPLLIQYLHSFKKRLHELEKETCIIQIGSNTHKINISDELKSKGLVITSIDDAIKNNSELVKKH